jgi:hypothetical protein
MSSHVVLCFLESLLTPGMMCKSTSEVEKEGRTDYECTTYDRSSPIETKVDQEDLIRSKMIVLFKFCRDEQVLQ